MAITQEHTAAPEVTSARTLITPAAFDGVVATVQDNNEHMSADLAERIVVEALKFVAACTAFPENTCGHLAWWTKDGVP